MRNEESVCNLTFRIAMGSRWNEEVVPGSKVVHYGEPETARYLISCPAPYDSSLRSLALGHLKVPKSSTNGYYVPWIEEEGNGSTSTSKFSSLRRTISHR